MLVTTKFVTAPVLGIFMKIPFSTDTQIHKYTNSFSNHFMWKYKSAHTPPPTHIWPRGKIIIIILRFTNAHTYEWIKCSLFTRHFLVWMFDCGNFRFFFFFWNPHVIFSPVILLWWDKHFLFTLVLWI